MRGRVAAQQRFERDPGGGALDLGRNALQDGQVAGHRGRLRRQEDQPDAAPILPEWKTGTAMEQAPSRTSVHRGGIALLADLGELVGKLVRVHMGVRGGALELTVQIGVRTHSSSNARMALPTAVACIGSRPPTLDARGTRRVP